uniref:Uncharacterized protein n=1 Tax=Sphaerodactylus townsendi TaxID=933632 RepID=A0ACB8FCG9_9SAUR
MYPSPFAFLQPLPNSSRSLSGTVWVSAAGSRPWFLEILLRSSLVNNRTQAKVAEELGMQEFAITNDKTKRPVALRTKTLADLLESFIAALYIDKDLEYVHTFMNVCFFPRLKEFILNQDWNDPKSQLQQCCLTLRTEGKEPDIPLYKTLQTVGPSHARTYTVAVYFKGERIGCGKGPSIQQAEMCAAMDALEKSLSDGVLLGILSRAALELGCPHDGR